MKLLIITIAFVSIIFSLKAQENNISVSELLDQNFEIKSQYFLDGELYLILHNDRLFYSKNNDGEFTRDKQIIYYCKTTINKSSCIKP